MTGFTIDEVLEAVDYAYEWGLDAPGELTESQVEELFALALRDCKGWHCVDCGMSTRNEYYIVSDELWDEYGDSRIDAQLCVGCLEARMGRELTASDFADFPVNHPDWSWRWGRSDRLRARLFGVTV